MISYRSADLLKRLEDSLPENMVGMSLIPIFPREFGPNKVIKQDGPIVLVNGWHTGNLNLGNYRVWVRNNTLFIKHKSTTDDLTVLLDGKNCGPIKNIQNGVVTTANGTEIYPEKVKQLELTSEHVVLTSKK